MSSRAPATSRRSQARQREYIDLLHRDSDVVADDDVIDHLIVLGRTGEANVPIVTMLCTPMAVFVHDYDRVFRVADELAPDDDTPPPKSTGRAFARESS